MQLSRGCADDFLEGMFEAGNEMLTRTSGPGGPAALQAAGEGWNGRGWAKWNEIEALRKTIFLRYERGLSKGGPRHLF